MAEGSRPSTSSDEVDFVSNKSRRENALKITNSLIENGVLANQKSTCNKVQNQISCATKALESQDGEGISEWVLRYNRLRQEQNVFLKMKGPNFLEAIIHKPKVRTTFYFFSLLIALIYL